MPSPSSTRVRAGAAVSVVMVIVLEPESSALATLSVRIVSSVVECYASIRSSSRRRRSVSVATVLYFEHRPIIRPEDVKRAPTSQSDPHFILIGRFRRHARTIHSRSGEHRDNGVWCRDEPWAADGRAVRGAGVREHGALDRDGGRQHHGGRHYRDEHLVGRADRRGRARDGLRELAPGAPDGSLGTAAWPGAGLWARGGRSR